MKLDINKDFLAYKDEAIKGYTLLESITILLAGVGAIGTCYLLVKHFDMSINNGVYTGMLGVASPILILGFYKYQGLSCFGLLREMFYVERTKLLTREVDEYICSDKYFSMKKQVSRKKFKKKENVPKVGTRRGNKC